MLKQVIYTYLGTNGTLNTPIHLEGIYSVRKVRLIAGEGKQLTKDSKNFFSSVLVPESEVDLWFETSGQE